MKADVLAPGPFPRGRGEAAFGQRYRQPSIGAVVGRSNNVLNDGPAAQFLDSLLPGQVNYRAALHQIVDYLQILAPGQVGGPRLPAIAPQQDDQQPFFRESGAGVAGGGFPQTQPAPDGRREENPGFRLLVKAEG